MNNTYRRLFRSLVLVVLATSFAACHFCGHGGHWGHRVPIRHCR